MKLLITGATASQVSIKRDTDTFAGLLVKSLESGGHDVVWTDPSVSFTKDYLSEFDSVVVGLAPPTSTAAHRIYGALSVIHYANELGTLRLFLDAPEPRRVWAGLRAIYKKPDDLTKEFHRKRKEFNKTSHNGTLDRLHNAVRILFTEEWPTTVFPVFPWMSYPSVSTEIPMTNSKNLVGLNFDSRLLAHAHENVPVESTYWVADVINSKWTKTLEKTITNRVDSVRASKWESSSDTHSRIRGAIGCLVSTHRHGNPWWSVALPQALASGIPVVTDWKLSSMLGPEWSVLAHAVEDMNQYDRMILAESQRTSYLGSVPEWDKSVELACNSLLRK